MNKPKKKPVKSPLKRELLGVDFSNPRKLATFHNWPSPAGPVQRDFGILTDDAGRERGITWTTASPRLTAGWHDRVRIVDGSDGRTYVICYSGDRHGPEGRAIIYRGNLKPECVILESGARWREVRGLCYGDA